METKLHMIGNAHLDPVWLWTWQEGFMEVLATFRSALDRIRENDDFIFTAAAAQYYQWVEEQDPGMFAEIQAAVKSGHWNIVGGWWIQPDDNMPCGESFARQGLYSQLYYKEKFGVTCKTGYCVDTFGHSAELPKLLRQAGMENFVFMRPGKHENEEVPPLFWWDAADGSRVLAFQIQNGAYCSGLRDPEELDRVYELAQSLGCDLMSFYGVGNHGGGPTRKQIEFLRQYDREHPGRICFSSPDRAFDAIRSQKTEHPVWKTELQHHASGCYSTASYQKRLHRRTEQALLAAESLCVAADGLGLMPYPTEKFREAWKNVMFNQFHDVMCGCSIKDGLDDATETFDESRSAARRLLQQAAGFICKQINTMVDGVSNAGKSDWQLWEEGDNGSPLVIFNLHPWEVRTQVTVNSPLAGVADPEGNPVPLQYVWARKLNGNDMFDSCFPAVIPPCGYAVYWIYRNRILHSSGKNSRTLSDACAPRKEFVLENEKIRAEFNPFSGHIVRLLDKSTGTVLNQGDCAVPVILDDSDYDTWAHARFVFRKEIARLNEANVEWYLTGELRNTIRVTYRYGSSSLRLDYTLCRDSDRLHVSMKTNWQDPHTILKLAFPLQGGSPRAFAQIPAGRIERPSNGEEEPMQQWCALKTDAAGLAILNDGRYSYDALDSELRITLLRNCLYADHYAAARPAEFEYVDEGVRYLELELMPFAGEPDGRLDRAAAELNFPPFSLYDSFHTGKLGRKYSFAEVDTPEVTVQSIKGSEDGKATVIRLLQTTGKPAECTLHLPLLNKTLALSFGPMELKTVRIEKDGTVTYTNILE